MPPPAGQRARLRTALLACLCLVAPLASAWTCALIASGVPAVDRAFAPADAGAVTLQSIEQLGPRPRTSRWARDFWSTHDVYLSWPSTGLVADEAPLAEPSTPLFAALHSRFGIPFRCASLERAGLLAVPVVDVPREWSLVEGVAGGWSLGSSRRGITLPLRMDPRGYAMNVLCFAAVTVGARWLARVWRARSTPPPVCSVCGARMYGISVCAACGARHQVL